MSYAFETADVMSNEVSILSTGICATLVMRHFHCTSVARHLRLSSAIADRLATQAREWSAARTALGLPRGAFISAFHLYLAGDPHEQPTPRRFGARTGRNAFRDHLHALEDAGVNHLALLLRPSRRPLKEVIDELASDVLPTLSTRSFAAKSAAG